MFCQRLFSEIDVTPCCYQLGFRWKWKIVRALQTTRSAWLEWVWGGKNEGVNSFTAHITLLLFLHQNECLEREAFSEQNMLPKKDCADFFFFFFTKLSTHICSKPVYTLPERSPSTSHINKFPMRVCLSWPWHWLPMPDSFTIVGQTEKAAVNNPYFHCYICTHQLKYSFILSHRFMKNGGSVVDAVTWQQ